MPATPAGGTRVSEEALALVQAAGLPASAVTPALLRAVEQWCEVLPAAVVAAALRRVPPGSNVLIEFRQALLAQLARLSDEDDGRCASLSTRPGGTRSPSSPPEPAAPHTLSAADRRALLAQDRLENMTDADYQQVIIARCRAARPKT